MIQIHCMKFKELIKFKKSFHDICNSYLIKWPRVSHFFLDSEVYKSKMSKVIIHTRFHT